MRGIDLPDITFDKVAPSLIVQFFTCDCEPQCVKIILLLFIWIERAEFMLTFRDDC